jgi:hypothetical protein
MKLIIMKKLVAPSAVLIFSLIVFQSCTKDSSKDLAENIPARPDRIIEAKVGTGQMYTVTIDNMGQLSINRQAGHFKISQTTTNPATGSLVYNYSPADGFTGTDEVVLEHKTEYIYSSNSSCGYGSNSAIGSRTNYISIKITVADQ